MKVAYASILFAFLSLVFAGCTAESEGGVLGQRSSRAASTGDELYWVATTGQVADALNQIAGEVRPNIKLLCGPGMDPHSFSASTADVQALSDAQAIFYNGFHLEAKLHHLLHHEFADKAWSMASAFPQDARLDWVEDGEVDPEAPFDPHIWNHLPGWAQCVRGLIDELCRIDPKNAATYRENGNAYVGQILSTHEAAVARFQSITQDRRVLVSAHDAFNYFAKNYGFETVAVLGVGNNAEADVATMREVAETVSTRKVPVIFIETITNPKVTRALQEACAARDWSVKIAETPLYSDDLGSEPPVDTFLGAFESNVDLIASSLDP